MIAIDGIFARAGALPFDILEVLESDPDRGNAELAHLSDAIRAEIEKAQGGILYRLTGPEPARATPMQYGGHFLERDRELLELANERGEVWLFVDAGPGAYLDFVSDLPAEVFAWDAVKTGFSLAEMRKLRSRKLCTNEAGADLPLESVLKQEAAKVG